MLSWLAGGSCCGSGSAPHHLCNILLLFLTCPSYTCRWVLKRHLILHRCNFCSFYLHFLLQDHKLLFWKKIPLLPNPDARILAIIGVCLRVFQLCVLLSLSSWFHSHGTSKKTELAVVPSSARLGTTQEKWLAALCFSTDMITKNWQHAQEEKE